MCSLRNKYTLVFRPLLLHKTRDKTASRTFISHFSSFMSIACVCNPSNLELLWNTYSLPTLGLGRETSVWGPQINPNLSESFHSILIGISIHSCNHDFAISNPLVPPPHLDYLIYISEEFSSACGLDISLK